MLEGSREDSTATGAGDCGRSGFVLALSNAMTIERAAASVALPQSGAEIVRAPGAPPSSLATDTR